MSRQAHHARDDASVESAARFLAPSDSVGMEGAVGANHRRQENEMEAAGVEPASGERAAEVTTRVSAYFFLLTRLKQAASDE